MSEIDNIFDNINKVNEPSRISNKKTYKKTTGLTFNKEQTEAIEKGIDFIKNGNPDEYFLIEGKAGTGKTTVIAEILMRFRDYNILCCALSHKAKGVIQETLNKYDIPANFYSIAGALGMDFDIETGRFIQGKRKIMSRPIHNNTIVIVDEGSMVNEETIDLIFRYKRERSKIIFLGDLGQLPPIRSIENPYYIDWSEKELDSISPIFYTKNKVKLIERVRQGEESPILPFADYFWENSQLEHPKLHPTENKFKRENIINNKGALIFTNNSSSIIGEIIKLFKKSVKNKNHNFVKFITYKNDTKNEINKFIHDKLFPENNFYNVGESIIFNDNYDEISNSTETEVLKISEMMFDKYNIGYYTLTIRLNIDGDDDEVTKDIHVVSPSYRAKHDSKVNSLFKKAYSLKSVNKDTYLVALKDAWGYKECYAKIDYSYSVTSHKAQGSTYNIAIVHERDINSVLPTSNRSKSQSIYTAITRAKNMVIVISDLETDQQDQKISLYKIEEEINNNKNK